MPLKIRIILLLAIGLLTSYRLFRPGFYTSHDDINVFRLQEFDSCIQTFQIPCRFTPTSGLGFGYPLFNFYSHFPYIIGEIFHLLGASFVDSTKLVTILILILRPIGMYLLASFFFGSMGGLFSSLVYSLAPYMALNTYVRGSLAENTALTILPFVIFFLLKRSYIYFILSFTSLLLTHNLTSLYSLPLIIAILILTKNFNVKFLFSIIISLGLSAFFIIPAFFEKSLTTNHLMTQGYFDYNNHFASLQQLLLNFKWGYGASVWGNGDGMSFQLGLPLLILSTISIYILLKPNLFNIIHLYKSKTLLIFISLYLFGLFFLFLTHQKSVILWQIIPILKYFQFPWRFLGPSVMLLSIVAGGLFLKTKSKIIFILLSLIYLLVNFSYFREEKWDFQVNDNTKLTGEEILRQSSAGITDFWPKYGKIIPYKFSDPPQFLTGNGQISNISSTGESYQAIVDVSSADASIIFPRIFFPKTTVIVNGIEQQYLIDSQFGQVTVPLIKGFNQIAINYQNTPIRFVSNTISLLSLIILSMFYAKKKIF